MAIVAAFATSHAYTFQEPETWDQRRERSKTNVARKAGRPASDTREAPAEPMKPASRASGGHSAALGVLTNPAAGRLQ